MKWLRLIWFLGALCQISFSLDREAFTFTKYSLDVTLDLSQQRVGVRGTITLRNDSVAPQKYVCLQISSSLGWRQIQLDGEPIEFISQSYTSDIDHTGALSEAILTLPQEVAPRGEVKFDIGYEGIIALDTTRLERIGVPKEIAKHNDWDEIGKSFTAVRGVGYVTWYPIAMESASLANAKSVSETIGRWKQREAQAQMNTTITAPDETLTIACGGGKISPHPAPTNDNPLPVKTDCSYSPLGLVTPIFAAAPFAILDRPSISVYYLADQKSAAEKFASAIESELPFITDWFAAPKQKAEVVGLPDAQNSPFENGVTLMTPLAQSNSATYSVVAAHQLTHAAFPSSRLWIYEGLAHFAQAFEIEHKSGRQAALDFMNSHLRSLIDTEKELANAVNVDSNGSLIQSNREELYRSKATYVWWMLRDTIGETPMKKALIAYQLHPDTEPSYMPHLIDAEAHRDLEWFFDDWVYHDRGLSDFRVLSAYTRKLANAGYMVTVTVENLGSAGAEVPINIRMDNGTVASARLEVRAKSKATIRIQAASIPLEVIVNDGSVPESDTSNNSFNIAVPAN